MNGEASATEPPSAAGAAVQPDDRVGGQLDDFRLPIDRAASRDAGKAARDRAPLRTLGGWDQSARTEPALDRLLAQHAVRVPELLPLRYARMVSSPWAYLRGAAAVMAADLATADNTGLLVQLCGDAHVLNFGLWRSPERRLLFDARDFDETLTGPFEWDLKRLCTSLFVLADSQGVAPATATSAAAAAVDAYRSGMVRYASLGELGIWYDAIDTGSMGAMLTAEDDTLGKAPSKKRRKNVVKNTQRQAHERSNEGVFDKLTTVVDGRRVITEDRPKRVHPDRSSEWARHALDQVIETYPPSVPYHLRRLLERFTVVDAVRQVVGVGSVGMRVFLVYLEGQSGRQPLFVQIKQATASVYEPYLAPSPFDNHGQRVATGQRLMQSATDIFLGFTQVDGHDYYVRQFRDAKIIPSGDVIAPILARFAATCGFALAKSHARTGDPTAICAYIGKGVTFREQLLAYARAYAAQTVVDHTALSDAVDAGRVEIADKAW